MSRWFRFYDDAINDPKLLKLSDKLYRVWVGLLCVASKNDGELPPLDDLALLLRMKPDAARKHVEQLREAGLIDAVDEALTPHNWNGRQFKSDVSNERVKQHRERKRNVTSAVTVTPPETEAEAEQKVHCPDAKASRTKPEYSQEFETAFWSPYPRSATMSKKEAWREWMKLDPGSREAACKAIELYKKHLRTKPNLETVHACRFLSQRRFDGFSDAPPTPTFDIRSSLA